MKSYQPSAVSRQPNKLLEEAKKIDEAFGISFDTPLPKVREGDPWKDTVAVCRASFAVASIVANPKQFPYTDGNKVLPSVPQQDQHPQAVPSPKGRRDRAATLSLKDIKSDAAEWARFEKATAAVVHDAVLNVAMGWKRIWKRMDAKKEVKS